MALIRSKAYEVSDNGYQLDNGIWISSGAAVPTHQAEDGDRYFRTNGDAFRNTSSPSPGTTWTQIDEGVGGGGSVQIQSYPFGNNTASFLVLSAGAYLAVRTFQFKGSSIVGTPTKIEIIAASQAVNKGFDVSIFDLSNANVIAEILDIKDTAVSIREGRKNATGGGSGNLYHLEITY